MNDRTVRVEGLEDCLKMLDRFPENILKIEKDSMREAAKEVAKHIRKGVPKRFKRLVKFKVYGKGQRDTYALMGLYNKHEIQGEQSKGGDPVFDWFKAYWSNYGTLSRRDPNHEFKTKIKPVTKGNPRRQSVGQSAQKFFERSFEGWQQIYLNKFNEAVKKRENELYNR